MTISRPQRVTQRSIAELAGVSQATVSLMLNGKADATTRIPDETRRRVLEVIRQTTYVADPAARRLAGVGNDILGVFTYESAFPNESVDFYTPLLTGIEAKAESLGCDLLLFTSAPVTDGRRRIFHENNRLRLADGCLLLGREMDADELTRLVDSEFPFVAIGRRDAADGRVPYVGVDYTAATASLARMAADAGHREVVQIALPGNAESGRDRAAGLQREFDAVGVEIERIVSDGSDLAAAWSMVQKLSPTLLIVEEPAHASVIANHAIASGVSIPADLSMIVLGDLARPEKNAIDFTRLSPPRAELGSQAVALLDQILHGQNRTGASDHDELPMQMLLDCTIVTGSTLSTPRNKGTSL
jgi:DNA-binding LacI/PurR family transcriptional regulator